MKVDIWAKMSDEIKELYQSIVSENIRACEKIVEYSWRYYVTYIKVLETIIDSQYVSNCQMLEKKKQDSLPSSTTASDKALCAFLLIEKKEAVKNIYQIATNKASSNPVKEMSQKILAKYAHTYPQKAIREQVSELIYKLS